jgi:hypothetical protein
MVLKSMEDIDEQVTVEELTERRHRGAWFILTFYVIAAVIALLIRNLACT